MYVSWCIADQLCTVDVKVGLCCGSTLVLAAGWDDGWCVCWGEAGILVSHGAAGVSPEAVAGCRACYSMALLAMSGRQARMHSKQACSGGGTVGAHSLKPDAA